MTGERSRYGEHPSQFYERWSAQGQRRRGRAVLVHGGWWRDVHDLGLMHPLCRALSEDQWEVFNLEFRRTGPEGGVWPDPVADVTAALRHIRDVDGDGVTVVIGHSAGAHLAMLGVGERAPELLVALAPVTDLRAAADGGLGEGAVVDFLATRYPEALDEASPLRRVPLGFNLLIVHGTQDGRVPIDQTRAYVAAARSAGDQVELVEVRGGDHFGVIDPDSPEGRAWLARLSEGFAPGPAA